MCKKRSLTSTSRDWFNLHIGGELRGFVVFYDGTIQGWSSDIHLVMDTSDGRANGGWVAGCVAIDLVNGTHWLAVGGDYPHGADRWILSSSMLGVRSH